MTLEKYNQIKKKIARQQQKQNDLFENYTRGIKKSTRITFARNAHWNALDNTKEFYSHVKYTTK